MKKYLRAVSLAMLMLFAGSCAMPDGRLTGRLIGAPGGPTPRTVLDMAFSGQSRAAADALAPETAGLTSGLPAVSERAALASLVAKPTIVEPASQPAATPLARRAAGPTPEPAQPLTAAQDTVPALPSTPPFAGTLLIADAGNNRLLALTPDKQIVWSFPAPGSLAPGQSFSYPDDAFFSADGRHIAVNEEFNHTIAVISYPEGKVVWQFGQPGVPGRDLQHLNRPDDAHLLSDGQVVVADIRNCRILLIPWDQAQPRALGSPADCSGRPGTFARPNSVMPLPNGNLLITEIYSRHISEIDMQGRVIRMVTLPLFYPSDAILTPRDTLIVSDYHSPGRVVEADWTGRILWSFPPPGSRERLDRPSIAFELPSATGTSSPGNVLIVDDHRHRVLIVDRTGRLLWQYGVTDAPGAGPGHLNVPDGVDLLPAGR